MVPLSSTCVLFCVWGSKKVCRNIDRRDGGGELGITGTGVLKWQKEHFLGQSKTHTVSLPLSLSLSLSLSLPPPAPVFSFHFSFPLPFLPVFGFVKIILNFSLKKQIR